MQGVPVRYFVGVEQLDYLLGSSIFGPFGAGVVNYNIAVVRSGCRCVVTVGCRGIGGGSVGVRGLLLVVQPANADTAITATSNSAIHFFIVCSPFYFCPSAHFIRGEALGSYK